MKLDYIIKHPPFKNDAGNIEPDFTGEYYVNSNQYEFYIGDCIWNPVEDKVGIWEIEVFHNGYKLVNKVFKVVTPY